MCLTAMMRRVIEEVLKDIRDRLLLWLTAHG